MPTKLSRRRSLTWLAAAPAIVPQLGRADTALPGTDLRIVVGFAQGAGADLMARLIAREVERRTGRRVSVENRPGATGALAGVSLKNGPVDGSLIAFMPSPTFAARVIDPDFPFDPLVDLAAITEAGSFQTALAVSGRIPAATLAAYVAWAKDGPTSRARIGIPAADAAMGFFLRLVAREFDLKLAGVPFRGASPLIHDLQDGVVPAGFGDMTAFLPAHRGGGIRILATTGRKRTPAAPAIPTAAESGYPDLEMSNWYGFFAAAAVPAPMIAAWNRQLAAALASEEISDQLAELGLDVETSTPERATALVAAHLKRWKGVLEALGLKPTN
jgi:tripartite-type tricarboxylate transporter receptor subunit TctC